jgi:hypothetical protein
MATQKSPEQLNHKIVEDRELRCFYLLIYYQRILGEPE